mmetsp:Transcript_52749/g.112875  ORF Transcript_52749/g.112875 Transcript_52749/m.112875 type:complete len:223 (+) Transcript_52749:1049-1717(+)
MHGHRKRRRQSERLETMTLYDKVFTELASSRACADSWKSLHRKAPASTAAALLGGASAKRRPQRSRRCTPSAWPAQRVGVVAEGPQKPDSLSKTAEACSVEVSTDRGVKYKTLRKTWNESSKRAKTSAKASWKSGWCTTRGSALASTAGAGSSSSRLSRLKPEAASGAAPTPLLKAARALWSFSESTSSSSSNCGVSTVSSEEASGGAFAPRASATKRSCDT